MNILIVSQYFWPEEFRINDLARGLVELGHQVTVLTAIPNYPQGKFFKGYGLTGPARETHENIEIIRLPVVSRGGSRGVRLALNYASYALSGLLLGPLKCRGKYDVIFVCQYSPVTIALPGILLRWLKNIPMAMWIQDLWPESLIATDAVNSRRIIDLVDRLVSFIYEHCDSIWIQSRAFEAYLQARDVDSNIVNYLSNWAEDSYVPDANADEREITVLPEGFKVLFAGNIGAAQDFPTILKAAEMLSGNLDIQWIILGDGSDFSMVQQEVAKRGLDNCFHLLGRYPVADMPWFFARADALLVTLKKSPIFLLTIPSKLQSYLACGRPVVAALEGEGARVVAESGAGVVCEPEQAGELASRIMELYAMDATGREQMGKCGRSYYDSNFQRSKLITEAERLLINLVQQRHSSYNEQKNGIEGA